MAPGDFKSLASTSSATSASLICIAFSPSGGKWFAASRWCFAKFGDKPVHGSSFTGVRFTIGLKRRTQNLQLSTRSPADCPTLYRQRNLASLFGHFVASHQDPHANSSVRYLADRALARCTRSRTTLPSRCPEKDQCNCREGRDEHRRGKCVDCGRGTGIHGAKHV